LHIHYTITDTFVWSQGRSVRWPIAIWAIAFLANAFWPAATVLSADASTGTRVVFATKRSNRASWTRARIAETACHWATRTTSVDVTRTGRVCATIILCYWNIDFKIFRYVIISLTLVAPTRTQPPTSRCNRLRLTWSE
jgi:hypothetical protein